MTRVCGIAGSLRRDSYNRALLRAAQSLAPDGMTIEIWDRLADIPPYNADVEAQGDPEPVSALKAAIRAADALLIVTPEYNYGVPGVLKNAVDWASRPLATSPLRNKPVAVIGASTGMFGAVWAQAELRKVLGTTGARVTDVELAVGHAHEHLDLAGHPIDPAQAEALRDSVAMLMAELQPLHMAA